MCQCNRVAARNKNTHIYARLLILSDAGKHTVLNVSVSAPRAVNIKFKKNITNTSDAKLSSMPEITFLRTH